MYCQIELSADHAPGGTLWPLQLQVAFLSPETKRHVKAEQQACWCSLNQTKTIASLRNFLNLNRVKSHNQKHKGLFRILRKSFWPIFLRTVRRPQETKLEPCECLLYLPIYHPVPWAEQQETNRYWDGVGPSSILLKAVNEPLKLFARVHFKNSWTSWM